MNKLACACSEDANQSVNLQSLISLSFLSEETFDPWLHRVSIKDSNQTVHLHSLISLWLVYLQTRIFSWILAQLISFCDQYIQAFS